MNRPTDVDLSTKTEVIKLDLGGRDENEVITALFQADAAYKDDLGYQAFPSEKGDSYNSNSYVSGLLRASGVTTPELDPSVPGYDKPVPQEEFEPKPEKE